LFVGKWAEEATEAKWMLEVNGKRFGPSDVDIPLQECTGRWVQEEQRVLIHCGFGRRKAISGLLDLKLNEMLAFRVG
jgi:hypothetical protein